MANSEDTAKPGLLNGGKNEINFMNENDIRVNIEEDWRFGVNDKKAVLIIKADSFCIFFFMSTKSPKKAKKIKEIDWYQHCNYNNTAYLFINRQ